jgi:hypothetical protein
MFLSSMNDHRERKSRSLEDETVLEGAVACCYLACMIITCMLHASLTSVRCGLSEIMDAAAFAARLRICGSG